MRGTEIASVLPDIPRIFTAFAEWLACMQCLVELKHKITGWKYYVTVVCMLLIQSIFFVMTGGLNNF